MTFTSNIRAFAAVAVLCGVSAARAADAPKTGWEAPKTDTAQYWPGPNGEPPTAAPTKVPYLNPDGTPFGMLPKRSAAECAKLLNPYFQNCGKTRNPAEAACNVKAADEKVRTAKNLAKTNLADDNLGFQGCQEVVSSAAPALQKMLGDKADECGEKRKSCVKECTISLAQLDVFKKGLGDCLKELAKMRAVVQKSISQCDEAMAQNEQSMRDEQDALKNEAVSAQATCDGTAVAQPSKSALQNANTIADPEAEYAEKTKQKELDTQLALRGIGRNEDGSLRVLTPQQSLAEATRLSYDLQGYDTSEPVFRAMTGLDPVSTTYSEPVRLVSGDAPSSLFTEPARFAGPAPGPATATPPASSPVVSAPAPQTASPDQSTGFFTPTAAQAAVPASNAAAAAAMAPPAQQPAVAQATPLTQPYSRQPVTAPPQATAGAPGSVADTTPAGPNTAPAVAAGAQNTMPELPVPELNLKPAAAVATARLAAPVGSGLLKGTGGAVNAPPPEETGHGGADDSAMKRSLAALETTSSENDSGSSGGAPAARFRPWWAPSFANSMFKGSSGEDRDSAAKKAGASVDLRKFLPGGAGDPKAAGLSGTAKAAGLHGPHAVLWNEVRGRYHSLQSTLITDK